MKNIHKVIASLMVVLLLVCMLPLSANAEENTPKEEVIYINLNADGSVKDIHVVNIFELDADGKIIDYGKYESLRNMTTTDALGYANETITVDVKAGRLYYEGKLSTNVMPWNISIHYYMDGVEYSSKDIAGKSGALKITIQITKNEECVGNFFEGMALQTTLSLDTKTCTDIQAAGATMANVGSKKQMTFTILPGKGADLEITANVKDFQMDGISLNGVKLKLNVAIDDASIEAKIQEILDAVKKVDDGTGKIQEGMSDLYDGTTQIKDKVGEMTDGVGQLAGGAGELADGLAQIVDKNGELMDGAWQVYEGLCAAAEMVINQKLQEYGLDTIDLTPKNYEKVLKELLETIDEDNIYALAYEMALQMVTEQVEARQDEVYMGYIESIADSVYMTYLESQAEALYKMAARKVLKDQLIESGVEEAAVEEYLDSESGQSMIQFIVDGMTDEQKELVIQIAYESLTEDQKRQIRDGAVATLTEDQKRQIREGYIDQMMKSKEVTDQIDAAVASAGTAVSSIVSLKSQLDNYGVFYDGLKTYTDAVDAAANGAQTLDLNMQTLNEAVGTLHTALGTLNDGAKDLLDGATELKDGTNQFREEMAGSEDEIGGMINSIVDSFSGSNVELGSFVSDRNTNTESVQFVIKTEAIVIPQPVAEAPQAEPKLTFWQKLLRLFGLY